MCGETYFEFQDTCDGDFVCLLLVPRTSSPLVNSFNGTLCKSMPLKEKVSEYQNEKKKKCKKQEMNRGFFQKSIVASYVPPSQTIE